MNVGLPLIEQAPPDMTPLRESHEADQLEAELKGLFLHLFEQFVRPAEREINTVGTPHLGSFEQFERAVKNDGLAIVRRGDEESMRYLFRAWKARNPKRGLHMLRLYMRLLWPEGWRVDQLWCSRSGVYPVDLRLSDGGDHFLTSRVNVTISSGVTSGADVDAVAPALRSVVPARILLTLTLEQRSASTLGVAASFYSGAAIQSFTANCV